MFGVSLISLFCYHCYLVVENRSTLGNYLISALNQILTNIFDYNFFPESFRPPIFRTGPDKHGFSLGRFNNFQEVFGEDPKTWFIPIGTRYFYFSCLILFTFYFCF